MKKGFVLVGIILLFMFANMMEVVTANFIAPSPTCSDGRQNQDELGVDCEGVCPAVCPINSCTNWRQDSGELGVDCGEVCPTCPTGINEFSGTSSCGGITLANSNNGMPVLSVYRTTSDYTHREIARAMDIIGFGTPQGTLSGTWYTDIWGSTAQTGWQNIFVDGMANVYPYYLYSFDVEKPFGNIIKYPHNLLIASPPAGSCPLSKPMEVNATRDYCTGVFKLSWDILDSTIYLESQKMSTMKTHILYATSINGPFNQLLPEIYLNLTFRQEFAQIGLREWGIITYKTIGEANTPISMGVVANNYTFTYSNSTGEISKFDRAKQYYFKVVSEPRYNITDTPLRATESDVFASTSTFCAPAITLANWTNSSTGDNIATAKMDTEVNLSVAVVYNSLAGIKVNLSIYNISNNALLFQTTEITNSLGEINYKERLDNLVGAKAGAGASIYFNATIYNSANVIASQLRSAPLTILAPTPVKRIISAEWKNFSTGAIITESTKDAEINLSVSSDYLVGTLINISVYNSSNNFLLYKFSSTTDSLGGINYKTKIDNLVENSAGVGALIYFNATIYNSLPAMISQTKSGSLNITATPIIVPPAAWTCLDNTIGSARNSTGSVIDLTTESTDAGVGCGLLITAGTPCCPTDTTCTATGCAANSPQTYTACSQLSNAQCTVATNVVNQDPGWATIPESMPKWKNETLAGLGRTCADNTKGQVCSIFECKCGLSPITGTCEFQGTTKDTAAVNTDSCKSFTGQVYCSDSCSTSYTPTGACANDLQPVNVKRIYIPKLTTDPAGCILNSNLATCSGSTAENFPCGRALAALPAFGTIQAAIGVVIIALAYFIYLRFARTKNRRVRTRGKKKHKKA